MNRLRIAVDFDGTIVEHMFPAIGKPNPGAIDWLIRFADLGCELILWTMRSDNGDNDYLTQAVKHCKDRGLFFDAVNAGISDRTWTTSPKAYANLYIDDAAFGCPLMSIGEGRPMVDWSIVGPAVMNDLLDQEVMMAPRDEEEEDNDLGMFRGRDLE